MQSSTDVCETCPKGNGTDDVSMHTRGSPVASAHQPMHIYEYEYTVHVSEHDVYYFGGFCLNIMTSSNLQGNANSLGWACMCSMFVWYVRGNVFLLIALETLCCQFW